MAELHETPFTDAQEAFFYMVNCQRARADGARYVKGQGIYNRPCHPDDIKIVIDRLYRQRRLTIDHMRILRHYGIRHMPPDERRPKEEKAAILWNEAMDIIHDALRQKGIIE